ncbi:diacylglycerol O acyltransferase 1 [Trichuris trichiura]|uniref:O-acyltransferase n=1 Tax=Trichuris trichiura TaxID=36087 RepID=A0A077YYJ2_TRITR|nr:diacylglycerol O acyltransferase 1 [Trichuris trichiura]
MKRREVRNDSNAKLNSHNAFAGRVPKSGAPIGFDRPLHVAQDSLLCSSSMYTNYRGFFTLSMILLALSNIRVALENLIKYGILINHQSILLLWFKETNFLPAILIFVVSHIFILTAIGVEKCLVNGVISQRVGTVITIANLVTLLTFPAMSTLATDSNPLGTSVCLMFYWSLFMKLVSYAHVNHWYRTRLIRQQSIADAEKHELPPKSDIKVTYPNNLTLKNIYYFVVAPTLCYELNFPRSPRIRKGFLLKRFLEVVFLPWLIMALGQQWIFPIVRNSVSPFEAMDYSGIAERLLKLAIPNHLLWLALFYLVFHSFLNFMAELLRFADREFYRDWWNADTSSYFWKNWNIPVHRWCVRHLYKPLLSYGCSSMIANVSVFVFSAFFHEYLTSVPLHIFRIWAFVGMVMQIPLNIITSAIPAENHPWGNLLVWLSLILGQPLCILMYYHDWYVAHRHSVGE